MTATVDMTLKDIHTLTRSVLMENGANAENAEAVAETVTRAERDKALSHGLFRVPGYVTALKSGKVDGKARPVLTNRTPAVLTCDVKECLCANGS